MVGKGSGRLKKSIRRIRVTQNSVTIGTDVPYAQIHNEGGTIKKTVSVKSHRRKMNTTIPQRQFIGESAQLMHKNEELMGAEMNLILK